MRLPRPRRGADNPGARLSPSQAKQILARYRPGETTLRDLAAETGVGKDTIWRLVNRHTYREE